MFDGSACYAGRLACPESARSANDRRFKPFADRTDPDTRVAARRPSNGRRAHSARFLRWSLEHASLGVSVAPWRNPLRVLRGFRRSVFL